MKIGQKLVLGFLLVSALIALVGYIAIIISQEALQERIGSSSVALAVETLDKIDRNIYSRIELFQDHVKHITTQKFISESNEDFEKLDDIQEYIFKQDEEWISAPKETVTQFMRDLIDNELSAELRELMEFYKERYGYYVFAEAFVTNKYGANVSQTAKTSDYRQDDEDWWQMAMEKGLHVSDVQYDKSAGVYSTDIGIRIDDKDGNFIGAMKIVLNIEEVINILTSVALTEKYHSRYFKLLNKDGKLIHVTKEKRDFEFLRDVSNEDYAEKIKEDEGYFINIESGEEEELFAFARSGGFKDFKGLGWILIVEHEIKEIFAPVERLKNILKVISFAVTLFAILVGILISHSISKPIRKLIQATVKIGKGNIDTKVDIKSRDEIGALASSFNKMTEDLKNTTTSIERLNKEIVERKRTEEQLIQAEKMAALGTLSAGMAHEMNNPLMGTMLLTETILSEKKKSTKEYKTLLQIVDGLKRISNVISKLLVFSRKEKIVLKIENINPIVNATIPLIMHEYKLKKVELVKELGENLPCVEVAKNSIQQVLVNILLNAKDAVLKTKLKKIKISTCLENDMVNIRVKDEGCGIKRENLKRVFDPFFTTKPAGKGLGMGMSIVRNIIEQHNGKIDIVSEENKGTEVIISLPVAK